MRRTIALSVAAVALAGCGMLPAEQPKTVVEKASATPTQPQNEIIATRETKVASGGQYGKARVEITSLKRQGRTATLNWTVTAIEGQVNLHNGMGTATLDFSVANVSLIDPVNAKRYRVARNGAGADATCVCSGTQGQFLKAGDASTLYAVFAAPPPEITKVNVEMPMVGVFADVPLS